VTLSPDAPIGKLRSKLTILTNIERIPKHLVRVKADVVGLECTVTPRLLVFGPDLPGVELGPVSLECSEPVEVVQFDTEIPGITCDPPLSGARTSHVLTLRLAADAAPGDKVGTLHIVLRQGEYSETHELRVFGTVAQNP